MSNFPRAVIFSVISLSSEAFIIFSQALSTTNSEVPLMETMIYDVSSLLHKTKLFGVEDSFHTSSFHLTPLTPQLHVQNLFRLVRSPNKFHQIVRNVCFSDLLTFHINQVLVEWLLSNKRFVQYSNSLQEHSIFIIPIKSSVK